MTGSRTMLYVSCGGTQEIIAYRFEAASGALARHSVVALPGAVAAVDQAATSLPGLRAAGAPLAVNPDGRTLYAVTRTEPCRVFSWRIDGDGSLHSLGEAPGVEGTPYLAVDRSGKWLLGAAYHADCAWLSAIGSDGAVTEPPVQRLPGLVTAHGIAVHPNGRVVYFSATGVPAVQVCELARGALARLGAAPVASVDATPRHMALHPSARWLFVMNESSSVVDVFSVSADGRALAPVHALDLRPAGLRGEHGLGADLVCSGDGRFVYACERRRGTVSVLAIDADDGKLALRQTVEVGRIPRSLALSPDGRFLATAVQGDGLVRIDAIGADGTLTPVGAETTGGAPVWAAFVALPDQGSGV